MSDGIEFVVPDGQISPEDRLRHIAIQAVSIMLRGWFEEEELSPEEAEKMVAAVMQGLLSSRMTTP